MYSHGLQTLPSGSKDFGAVTAQVSARADLGLPDHVLGLQDLRFNGYANVEVPDVGEFALTDWSRRQLASILGVRWDKWFQTARTEEIADEVNRRLRRSNFEMKIRLARHPGDPDDHGTDGVLRAFLGPTYTPIDDVQVFDSLRANMNSELASAKFVRTAVTDRSSHFAGVAGDPVDLDTSGKPDWVYPGFLIRNSEVGFTALTIDVFIFRLVCTNGLMVTADGKRLLYRQHRPIEAGKLSELLGEAFSTLAASSTVAVEQLGRARSEPLEEPEKVIEVLVRSARLPAGLVRNVTDAYHEEPNSTRFGVVQALTRAARALPPDSRFDLEQLAGRFLAAA